MRFVFALLASAAFAISPAMADDAGFYVGAGVMTSHTDSDWDNTAAKDNRLVVIATSLMIFTSFKNK